VRGRASCCRGAAPHWPQVERQPGVISTCLLLKTRLHRLATHAAARAWLPRSGALLAAQGSFLALPDELLGRILRRAWADRPARPAAEEARHAAGLACLCRRVRALLRVPPLQLALDFGTARLSADQRRWVIDHAQAGRVEAVSCALYEGDEADTEVYQESFIDLPLLNAVLSRRHSHLLLRFSGMPMRMMACADPELGPPIGDLSGDAPRLNKLGIDCRGIRWLHSDDNGCPLWSWLWHELLPGALEELELRGLPKNGLGRVAWMPRPGAAVAAGLPRLHTLRVTPCEDEEEGELMRICKVPLLQEFAAPPHFEVLASGTDVHIHNQVFGWVKSVRVEAGGHLLVWVDSEEDAADAAVVVDRLCPAGLQAAELCAEHHIDLGPSKGAPIWQVVREMVSRCGDRFAVEVGVPDEPGDGGVRDKADVCRLAWRRWPAPNAPDLPTAKAAHERARAWAASFS